MSNETTPQVKIAFVCVQNAGRSQMAYAFAKQEISERGFGDSIDIITGGTDPATHVHEEVVDMMNEKGIDLSSTTPREITPSDLEEMDIVITMGCSADDICPVTWRGDSRDWALNDPHGQPVTDVRQIRDEIERRVKDLFDELAIQGDNE